MLSKGWKLRQISPRRSNSNTGRDTLIYANSSATSFNHSDLAQKKEERTLELGYFVEVAQAIFCLVFPCSWVITSPQTHRKAFDLITDAVMHNQQRITKRSPAPLFMLKHIAWQTAKNFLTLFDLWKDQSNRGRQIALNPCLMASSLRHGSNSYFPPHATVP